MHTWADRLGFAGLLATMVAVVAGGWCLVIRFGQGYNARAAECRHEIAAAMLAQRLETHRWPPSLNLAWISEGCRPNGPQARPLRANSDSATYEVTVFERVGRGEIRALRYEVEVRLQE